MSAKAVKILTDVTNYVIASGTFVWAFTPDQIADLAIKLVIGLPPAMYMCFKIYNEFLKKKK